jgi:hypothetical protein
MLRDYSKELSDFLSVQLGIDSEQLPSAGGWVGSGNSIGALALRLGVMTLDEIEQVADLQAVDGELFGQVAHELGFCSKDDVVRLLQLQALHRCIDQSGLLYMASEVAIPKLLRLLADYAESHGLP